MSVISGDPVIAALTTPGHLTFPDNLQFKTRLEAGDGRMVRQPTGHLIFYRSNGLRILATDPAGRTVGPGGVLTRELANPNSILEFTYKAASATR